MQKTGSDYCKRKIPGQARYDNFVGGGNFKNGKIAFESSDVVVNGMTFRLTYRHSGLDPESFSKKKK